MYVCCQLCFPISRTYKLAMYASRHFIGLSVHNFLSLASYDRHYPHIHTTRLECANYTIMHINGTCESICMHEMCATVQWASGHRKFHAFPILCILVQCILP